MGEKSLMRILVVEDEVRVGSLARRVLEGVGSTVDVVESAEEAFEALQDTTREYHVVVIDRVLPGASGDELAADVAALCPEAGIVLTSGRVRTSRPVYDVWLEKPYGPRELIRAVSAALVARSMRRYRGRPRATAALPT